MRPVLTVDLETAARAMAALPPDARAAAMAVILAGAHAADRARRRTGRAHPLWGRGTLADAAAVLPLAAPPRVCNAHACAALAAVLEGLARWRTDPARRSFKLARGPYLR